MKTASYMNPDLLLTFLLLTMVFGVAIAYLLKVFFQGRTQYGRVEQQGGSSLLSKRVMEMAYWVLQPLGDFLIYVGFSANNISFFSLIFGGIAGVSLAFGHFGSAGFFSAFCALFDSVDGIVARKMGTASNAGEVLDASVDRYVEFFFFAGLVLYYQQMSNLILLTLMAFLGSFMVSYSTAKAEALNVTPPRGNMRRPERALYLTLGAILSPISAQIFPGDQGIGYPMVLSLALVASLANGSAVHRLYAIAKEV